MRKLLLGALPPRPGETAGAAPELKTSGSGEEDEPAAQDAAQKQQKEGDSTSAAPAPAPVPRGPIDRYIAPEMKDYIGVYRVATT